MVGIMRDITKQERTEEAHTRAQAARYTAAADKTAVYAYSDNYLIDLKHAVIMDVEATTAIRQAEVGAAKTMLDRTAEQFEVAPSRLVADTGYGSAEMIGWLVDERGIGPHVKLMDKSERTDGTIFVQRLRLRSKRQPLCLPWRQRA
jgi:Transposase DDE domain